MSYENNNIVRIGAIYFASSFKIVALIPSGPAALCLICSLTLFSLHNLFCSEFMFTDIGLVLRSEKTDWNCRLKTSAFCLGSVKAFEFKSWYS